MPTSATNELGRHPYKKVITELLENQQQKEHGCSGLMENISQLWGEILPLKAKIDGEQRREESFLHQDDTEITWIIDKHHNSNIP